MEAQGIDSSNMEFKGMKNNVMTVAVPVDDISNQSVKTFAEKMKVSSILININVVTGDLSYVVTIDAGQMSSALTALEPKLGMETIQKIESGFGIGNKVNDWRDVAAGKIEVAFNSDGDVTSLTFDMYVGALTGVMKDFVGDVLGITGDKNTIRVRIDASGNGMVLADNVDAAKLLNYLNDAGIGADFVAKFIGLKNPKIVSGAFAVLSDAAGNVTGFEGDALVQVTAKQSASYMVRAGENYNLSLGDISEVFGDQTLVTMKISSGSAETTLESISFDSKGANPDDILRKLSQLPNEITNVVSGVLTALTKMPKGVDWQVKIDLGVDKDKGLKVGVTVTITNLSASNIAEIAKAFNLKISDLKSIHEGENLVIFTLDGKDFSVIKSAKDTAKVMDAGELMAKIDAGIGKLQAMRSELVEKMDTMDKDTALKAIAVLDNAIGELTSMANDLAKAIGSMD